MKYSELQTTTNFTFLRGASHPGELVAQAHALGYDKIAVTDRNSLAGIVRAHAAAKDLDIKIIPGCRLDLVDGPSLLAYPTDKDAYARLSALISLGNLRTEKGKCELRKTDVYQHAQGMIFAVVAPHKLNARFDFDPTFGKSLNEYRQAFGSQLYLAASKTYQGADAKRLFRLAALANYFSIPLVATNDVHYHHSARRQLQDVLTCIREKCTIDQAGFRLLSNAERFLKPIPEMHRLFRQYPDALSRTAEIAEACQFSLSELKYVYPEEITSGGRSPQEELTMLAWQGANERYGQHLPDKIIKNIKHELSFIAQMDYAAYFLTVYDVVKFARSKGILCQGRGSAANSTVCYCLGVTSVDPSKFDLLFERFISSARAEPPDIDIDFEHERREEVIQYIYNRYGRDRAAIVATVTTMHQKGAIRDVGKAMGLSVDTISRLSDAAEHFSDESFNADQIKELGLNPDDQHLKKTLALTDAFRTFPRQLGQHTGGFVITRGKITDLCPILNARMQDRTNIEWDKNDIEALGFLKVDVLALGMLTCIRKAIDLAKLHYGLDLTLANIPQDDPRVYAMISAADTIGVFQIESRAQQAMLPRMKPTCFYDLVIEVALVRPGPIVGDMVHPYLRRRNGEEPVAFPSKELEEILGRTLGVPLFQEQVMKVAIVAGGFTPAEADELRRSMATFKVQGELSKFGDKLISGMIARGYTEDFARRIFNQLKGFGAYGFPESHAASFALLVYVSSWIKCYYPDVFAAAMLNSYPLGFYQPAQLIIDARKHGVVVLPVDVNHSNWDNTLEALNGKYRSLRLGFRQINGISQPEMELLEQKREAGYCTLTSLIDIGITAATLLKLADADAFRSLNMDRRSALWEASALKDRPVGMFTGQPSESHFEVPVDLPAMSAVEHVFEDYATTGLSLKGHPVSFIREKLKLLGISTAEALNDLADGTPVKIAGLVLIRQRPSTAKGVTFITTEDETGVINIVVFQNTFQAYRQAVRLSSLLMVEGTIQREGQVIHVIAKAGYDMRQLWNGVRNNKGQQPTDQTLTQQEQDIRTIEQRKHDKNIQTELFPKSRDFK